MPSALSRPQITTLVAVAIHAALFWGATSRPVPAGTLVTPSTLENVEVEVQAEPEPAPAPTEPPVQDPTSQDPTEPAAPVVGRRTVDAPAPPSSASIASVEPPAAAPAIPDAPAASGAPVALFDTTPKAIGLSGTGAYNPFNARGALPEQPVASSSASNQMRPVVPKTAAEAKAAVEAAMREPLGARIAKGLGPEGPVLAALKEATYGGFAPLKGSATFMAVVDADGLVTALRLLRSHPRGHDADSGWDDAREHAASALAGKKLSMRGGKGAELHIEVHSDVVLPSGKSPDGISVNPSTTQSFDVADLASKGRHVVKARLVGVREM